MTQMQQNEKMLTQAKKHREKREASQKRRHQQTWTTSKNKKMNEGKKNKIQKTL